MENDIRSREGHEVSAEPTEGRNTTPVRMSDAPHQRGRGFL